jgi:predicted AAA+ superfamily ATPase
MIFERKKYLDELIAGRGNGLVKIITGVRRCGKSFLLFDIWHNWLLITSSKYNLMISETDG